MPRSSMGGIRPVQWLTVDAAGWSRDTEDLRRRMAYFYTGEEDSMCGELASVRRPGLSDPAHVTIGGVGVEVILYQWLDSHPEVGNRLDGVGVEALLYTSEAGMGAAALAKPPQDPRTPAPANKPGLGYKYMDQIAKALKPCP